MATIYVNPELAYAMSVAAMAVAKQFPDLSVLLIFAEPNAATLYIEARVPDMTINIAHAVSSAEVVGQKDGIKNIREVACEKATALMASRADYLKNNGRR